MIKISKAERKNNNILLKTEFEKCTADMQDLSNYFLAYNKLISSVMENLNKHIEDDASTWKETLDELYGMYGCLEDEFCYLTLFDDAAPNVNKRREHQKELLLTNYEYLMLVESKKSLYSITSDEVEIAMMKAENIQKELFEIRQSTNKNNEGNNKYLCCYY